VRVFEGWEYVSKLADCGRRQEVVGTEALTLSQPTKSRFALASHRLRLRKRVTTLRFEDFQLRKAIGSSLTERKGGHIRTIPFRSG